MPSPVTLQISLAPSDFRHAEILLPHQIRTWLPQVSEILIAVDFHRSSGRFSTGWEQGKEKILALANSIPSARVLSVDYSPQTMSQVATCFFGKECPLPEKDFRGGPFYAYFFALLSASNNFVFHIDSDILFGGGSSSWLAEALEVMQKRREIFVTAPLPGPPAPDGKLRQLSGTLHSASSLAYDFTEMSTRLFLVDRTRFKGDFGPLKLRRPTLRSCLKAWLEGNPVVDLPEHLISQQMKELGMVRHEFLGAKPGMWSLHPPYRCADFYEKLPELVHRVETGHLPADQLGDHDINSSLVDWTEAQNRLKQNRWWQRIWRVNRWTKLS